MLHKKNIILALSASIILLLAGWLMIHQFHKQGNRQNSISEEPAETTGKQLALPFGFSNWILE